MLHLLVELARGQGARVVKEIDGLTSALAKEHEQGSGPNVEPHLAAKRRGVVQNNQLSFPESDFQLASAALADTDATVRTAGVRLAEALEERAKKAGSRPGLARVRSVLAAAIARKEGAEKVLEQTNLAHWHDATTSFAFDATAARPGSYWTAQDGLIAQLAGSGADFLLYDYPLTGTYQWSVEIYQGPWSESAVTHHGLVIEPFTGQGNASISIAASYQSLAYTWSLVRQDGFNTDDSRRRAPRPFATWSTTTSSTPTTTPAPPARGSAFSPIETGTRSGESRSFPASR